MPRPLSSWATRCRPSPLLAQAAGVYLAVPVAARIHEGVVWSNRDRRTLLDKLGALLLGLPWEEPVTVVADAYYAAAKFARALLATAIIWSPAFAPTAWLISRPPAPKGKRRGRPAFTAPKPNSGIGFRYEKQFTQGAQPGLWRNRRCVALLHL
jgi:hypothetical protein